MHLLLSHSSILGVGVGTLNAFMIPIVTLINQWTSSIAWILWFHRYILRVVSIIIHDLILPILLLVEDRSLREVVLGGGLGL